MIGGGIVAQWGRAETEQGRARSIAAVQEGSGRLRQSCQQPASRPRRAQRLQPPLLTRRPGGGALGGRRPGPWRQQPAAMPGRLQQHQRQQQVSEGAGDARGGWHHVTRHPMFHSHTQRHTHEQCCPPPPPVPTAHLRAAGCWARCLRCPAAHPARRPAASAQWTDPVALGAGRRPSQRPEAAPGSSSGRRSMVRARQRH